MSYWLFIVFGDYLFRLHCWLHVGKVGYHVLNRVGTYGYILGIPLLVMSYFLLGKGIGARTLFATLASPCIMNVVSTLAYPSAEALQRLSPTELCGGLVNPIKNLNMMQKVKVTKKDNTLYVSPI